MLDKSPNKVISLEILRFLAAFCVMVEHQIAFMGSQNISKPGRFLHGFNLPPDLPVLFFFVLSGFVMMTAHGQDFGKIHQIPRFVWRRFCRIYPLYWLSLPVWFYFLWPTLQAPHYLTKIFTLYPFQTEIVELNSPAWSLRFEISFYLMFAISFLPYIGRFWLAAWIILVFWNWFPGLFIFHAVTAATGWHPVMPVAVSWHFFGIHEFYFFAGLGAGLAYRRLHWPNFALWLLLALSFVAIIKLLSRSSWGFAYPSVNDTPVIAVAIAVFIFSLSALERSRALRIGRWGARLGDMSYPLYIFHPVIIFLMMMAFGYHPAWRQACWPFPLFTLYLAITLPLTAAITFLIDRPLQRALRNIDFRAFSRPHQSRAQTRP
jgi:exopolysaccharide production protein ExoZ